MPNENISRMTSSPDEKPCKNQGLKSKVIHDEMLRNGKAGYSRSLILNPDSSISNASTPAVKDFQNLRSVPYSLTRSTYQLSSDNCSQLNPIVKVQCSSVTEYLITSFSLIEFRTTPIVIPNISFDARVTGNGNRLMNSGFHTGNSRK